MVKGKRRLSRTARTKALGAQHVCAYPRKAPGCAQRGAGEAPETFPHAFLLSPSPSSLPRDPLLPSAPLHLAMPRAHGGPLRRQGGGSYLMGKFPASRCDSPPPGLGLRARPGRRSAAASPPASEAAAAPAAATAKPAIPPVPPPRTAHTRASLAARIPALARVPEGTFLSRARPGRASSAPPGPRLPRLPGPAGARRSNFPRGAGAAPPYPVFPGQVPPVFPQGCSSLEAELGPLPDWDQDG